MNKCVKAFLCVVEYWNECDHYEPNRWKCCTWQEADVSEFSHAVYGEEVLICTHPNAIAEAERTAAECQRSDHS